MRDLAAAGVFGLMVGLPGTMALKDLMFCLVDFAYWPAHLAAACAWFSASALLFVLGLLAMDRL